ncbi:MAG: hypothetical protein ACON4P_00490 [Candidatus Puniceispirillales bacterium]
MAATLQIPLTNYQKYEYRSLLPHNLIIPFCRIVKIDFEAFLSHEVTKTDIKLLQWHEKDTNCKVLLENMRPNFVDEKIVPITKLPLPDSEGS